jgi:hypothetical protein
MSIFKSFSRTTSYTKRSNGHFHREVITQTNINDIRSMSQFADSAYLTKNGNIAVICSAKDENPNYTKTVREVYYYPNTSENMYEAKCYLGLSIPKE